MSVTANRKKDTDLYIAKAMGQLAKQIHKPSHVKILSRLQRNFTPKPFPYPFKNISFTHIFFKFTQKRLGCPITPPPKQNKHWFAP